MDIAAFRSSFPEFASEVSYPTARIQFWAGLADKMLNVDRWGDLLTEGTYLFVAHNIVLHAINIADSAISGQFPGRSTPVESSMSAGGVSVSVDIGSSIEEGGGHYNETVYGRQFLRLARIVGTGGYYVGGEDYIA